MDCNLQNNIVNTYYNDYKFFFSKLNVEGLGFGYKYTNGICTCEPCIHVFVTKKINLNCLCNSSIIPPLYKGIKTDVIESGHFTATSYNDIHQYTYSCISSSNNSLNINTTNRPPYIERIRPIEPGYCMGSTVSFLPPYLPNTGTFGYIVTDNERISKTYCLLSNNMAFASLNKAPIGTSVLQPSYKDGGRDPEDVVGSLLKFSPLTFSDSTPKNIKDFNTIDASIASYVTGKQISLINPFIPGIGIPEGIASPLLNMLVNWTGCIKGTQYGFINSLDVMAKILYPNDEIAWFKNIFLSSGSANSSDFGALVCDKNILALGLLFGKTNTNLLCSCYIKNITDMLKVTLLTLH